MGERPAYYPLFLDLANRKCLVVGGGGVGERKVRGLLEAGAHVTVVSPDVTDGIRSLAASGRVTWEARRFEAKETEGVLLVFAATDSEDVNAEVTRAAREAGCLVNDARAVDSDFVVPAVVRQGDLQVAVSTGGGSPAYARLIRERLEEEFGPEHAAFLALLEDLRPKVMERYKDDPASRRAVWDRLVNWNTLNSIREGRMQDVEELVSECLS